MSDAPTVNLATTAPSPLEGEGWGGGYEAPPPHPI